MGGGTEKNVELNAINKEKNRPIQGRVASVVIKKPKEASFLLHSKAPCRQSACNNCTSCPQQHLNELRTQRKLGHSTQRLRRLLGVLL